jgi:hypothetical protein
VPERNSPNPPDPDRRADMEAFSLLALRYLDGLLTENEALLLNEQLASSPEYRELFTALSVDTGVLNEMLLTASSPGQHADSSLRYLNQPHFAQVKRWFHTAGATRYLLAAVLLFVGLGIWMLRFNLPVQPQAGVLPNSKAPSEIYSTRLDSGTTRFTLPNVGYVIVDGPAEFNLLGPMRARLNSGRIKMRVTEESGHGFVVETPYGEVTDLGTEFGLDVSDKGKATGLVVFEGKVDLRVAEQPEHATTFSRVERLVGGDGVTFDRIGQLDRIMSIVTGKSATFQRENESRPEDAKPLIAGISDNLRASDTKRFYEIVRAGFGEDVRAFVDRTYEWNGLDEAGLPPYLVGADYILPFNEDKRSSLNITLALERPATVYILFDDRGNPPKWLTNNFTLTGDHVGLDEDQGPPGYGRPNLKLGKGAANSVDYLFSVWKQDVAAPGKIELGSREGPKGSRSMYGIVVVPLKTAPTPKTGT